MSHCSFFYTSDSSNPDSESSRAEVVEVCGARVPIIWPVMFSSEDVVAKDIDCEGDCEDGGEQFLGFVCTIEKAIERLVQRKGSLLTLLPKDRHQHFHNFLHYLKSSNRKYVIVAIDDIEQMNSESMVESGKAWGATLDGLDEPISIVRTGIVRYFLGSGIGSSWKVLLSYSSLSKGLFFSKLVPPLDNEQWLICGACSAEEIQAWQS